MKLVKVKVKTLSGKVHPKKSQRRKQHKKVALTQVTVKVKALGGPVHPKKSQRRKQHKKVALTQVTVKVKALGGPVHPRQRQRRKESMKLALTQVTVTVKVLSRPVNHKKGQRKEHQKLGGPVHLSTCLIESITKAERVPSATSLSPSSDDILLTFIAKRMKRYP